ncbi:kinesin family member 5B, b [Reticulomyxa filosa]|uniref:Kinesin-like protein n=1 Tax=Reticulomyxa filosa TaxID=46433 RepID=X6P1C5_RETFI|nr:kinesin family member 5B, b [Reticulomyxa filosa]|eukprot:ETO32051.1 kinesin family member 5B, b [Reticulomyxa filosa]
MQEYSLFFFFCPKKFLPFSILKIFHYVAGIKTLKCVTITYFSVIPIFNLIRFRPLNKIEQQTEKDTIVIEVLNENSVNIGVDPKNRKTFDFDNVFPPNTPQANVFEAAALPLVDAVLTGYNCTLFAYGQTGSGKTYTMEGDVDSDEHSGLIPRMVRTIFSRILDDDSAQNGNREYMVRVSFVEIYNERLRDLLNPSDEDLRIRDSDTSRSGVFIEGAHAPYVSDPDESSRSHAVFMLQLEVKDMKNGSVRKSKLMMVDLAGSEKVSKTNASGQTLKEAQQINKSLMTLGRVISALVEDKGHVPYRDSKLTRLLSDALGGNSKTCLIVTASPAEYNEEETVSTLRFGQSAKCIKNRVKVNAEFSVSEYKKIVAKLQFENKQLKLTIKKMQVQLNALANAAKVLFCFLCSILDYDIMDSAIAEIKDEGEMETSDDSTNNATHPPKKSRKTLDRGSMPNLGVINEQHAVSLSSASLFSEPPAFLNATEGKLNCKKKKKKKNNTCRLSELTEQMEDLREEIEDMKNSHALMEAERDELKEQLDKESESSQMLEVKLNEINKLYQASVRMNGENGNKIRTVEHENEDMSKRLMEFETENFQLKNELQQRDFEIESLLKELKLLKRKVQSNAKESSDDMTEGSSNQSTVQGNQGSGVKTSGDKKIRYITEVQVKALEDEWIKRMRKKDSEIKKWKEKYRQYFQKNEMNRNLREDWKIQLEEMKKAVLLQQTMTDSDKDRHTKEIYERDLEIVRLKRLVAVFTRQNNKNYQKNRQSYSSNASNEPSIVRAPVIIRGGQRRREQNVLRKMSIESGEEIAPGVPSIYGTGSQNFSEKSSYISDFKSDME